MNLLRHRFHFPPCLLIAGVFLSALSVSHAQSGSFIIPSIRANGGTDFAYWDLFARPPGSTSSTNFNYANPPALIDGFGEDADGNPSTAFAPRTVLRQTGTSTAFVTSSGAIYSFSNPLAVEVPYSAPPASTGEITNVIFQTMSGGARLDVNSVFLRYQNQGGQPVDLAPVFRALDDPQTGAFSERIISAFQWNLTGLNVRSFTLVFTTPTSMPLWEAQLDAVVGTPFTQELGYLLATRTRPLTRFGRPGFVDKNLPITADGRFFLEGEQLNLIAEAETGWQATGWDYAGTVTNGGVLPLTFPAQDITVTALFAPLTYATWRVAMFDHANALLGDQDDYLNDAISAPLVDHDHDGLNNAGEHAFAGDPYVADSARTQPQELVVDVLGVPHPAIRYRSNGLPKGSGDVVQTVRVSANNGPFTDNSQGAVTVEMARELQPDGSVLITERTVQPLGAFTSVALQVAWSVGGVDGTPLDPVPLSVTTAASLAAAQEGSAYELFLAANGGATPYRWSLLEGALPTGLVLDDNGRLHGLPQQSGTFSFTLQVEDALDSATTRAFNLSVASYAISTPSQLGSISINSSYQQTLAVVGGTAPFTWTRTGGELPSGLTLSAGGVLSGTPTVSGPSSFTVQVSDANQRVTSKAFELTVVDLQITTPSVLPVAVLNRAYPLALGVNGGKAPFTWSLKSGALPVGIDWNSSGQLTGTPLQTGIANFEMSVQDADGFEVSRSFTLTVSSTLPLPVLSPLIFPEMQVGAELNPGLQVQAINYPERFALSGLPPGLRWNARTGQISGRPTIAGTYLVQAQAFNSSGASATTTATVLVRALSRSLIGTFTGWSTRQAVNSSLGSLFSLKTTPNGAYTLSVRTGARALSARGFLNASPPHLVLPNFAGATLSLSIHPTTGALSGSHGPASVSGWRAVWDKNLNPASSRAGYYSLALDLASAHDADSSLPRGSGFASFTVPDNGLLRLAGKTADGQNLLSSGPLGPNGEILIYALQHANQGSVLGQLLLSEGANGDFSDNTLAATALTWQKPLTKGRTHTDAFGPLSLNVAGGYLAPSAKGQTVLGLPDLGAFDLEFTEGGIANSATTANVSGIQWTDKFTALMPATGNDARVSLRLNRNTGALTGTFTLTETTPPLVRRNVPFTGQIVRGLADDDVRAVGYFLLPQIPTSGQRPNQSPILSGSVLLTQPTP